MITMRLFAEEKRNGTIELLTTSPIRDVEIVLGKWLAALGLYVCMLFFPVLNFAFLFKYGNPDWKPVVIGCSVVAASRWVVGYWNVYFHVNQESDHRGRAHV